MQLSDFDQIPDGSTLYVRPVGSVSAAHLPPERALIFAGGRARYAGAIIYARAEDKTVAAGYVGAAAIHAFINTADTAAAAKLKARLDTLAAPRPALQVDGGRQLPFTRPIIMGVLNVTPDSFSDGGNFIDADKAVRHARAMMAAGADIIDIGGESTRPGATPVWEGEEADRIVPVIERLADERALLSVDSRNAFVMEKALTAGAHIVNDVSALTHDPESMALVAMTGAPVVLMHAQGDPRTMQDDPHYDHALLDIFDYLEARIEICLRAGIARDKIIIDPGIGFGKRVVRDNLALINGLILFQTLGCPVLLGASRKRFIGAITGIEDASERVSGSLAAALKGVIEGADILRVHDVAETAEAMKMAQAFADASVMDGLA